MENWYCNFNCGFNDAAYDVVEDHELEIHGYDGNIEDEYDYDCDDCECTLCRIPPEDEYTD